MAKRFRSEAKGNQSNSEKLQVENQKKWNLLPKKRTEEKYQKNQCNRRLQFWEYRRKFFFKKWICFDQSQYSSYNSEKI